MEKLIFIHGALGNEKEFEEISPLLSHKYEIEVFEIPHHGKKKDSSVPFTPKALIKDFLNYLAEVGPCYIYGFSLGGYIALSAAQEDQTNIKGIITHGTKLNWSTSEALKEVKSLDVSFLKEKVPPFFAHLDRIHGNYLSELLDKTAEFLKELGEEPLLTEESVKKISVPVRMVRGGRDKMVTKEETLKICVNIEKGHYFEIPSFIHPLGFLKAKFVARMIDVQLQSTIYKWAETEFGKIAYKEIGKVSEKSPVLLFLHEAIGSIAQWQDFPDQLCQELDLPGIVLEFTGYGFSSENSEKRNHRYLHNFALQQLPAFLQAINLENDILIIGHSDGGTNALLYSTQYPGKVKGIVTMAAHVINEKETKQGVQPAIMAFEAGKMKGLELYHGAKTSELFYAWSYTWLSEGFSDWNICDDIKGNTTPALIIQGKNDQYGTDEQVNIIAGILENGTPQFIKNCGHAPHLEKKQDVIQLIKEWSTKLN